MMRKDILVNNKVFEIEDLIIFGSQYYRSPLPARSVWRQDFENIAKLGFNAIKLTPVWRWVEPEPDRYDFDDIIRLLDLAKEFELGVVINPLWDAAPPWFFNKFPDSLMVTAEGRIVGPYVSSCRAVGGAPGPCLSNPNAILRLCKVLSTLAKKLKSHPGLLVWDVWNEPELNGTFLRYVGNGERDECRDLLCYCEYCQHKFITWLKKKYKSVSRLNTSWCRKYKSWEEVEIPKSKGIINDMMDWRMFFVDEMALRLSMLVSAVKTEDRQHPVMAHAVPKTCFNIVSCADDEWRFAQHCDLWGNTGGIDPFGIDMTRSSAKGKVIWDSEMHVASGDTLQPGYPTFNRMKKYVLIPISRGVKGFLFWQYRPELLGLEGPTWNLISKDGSPTPWTEGASRLAKLVLNNKQFLSQAKILPTDIGIIQYPEAEIFSWLAASSIRFYQENLMGCYRALYDSNLSVDFIHPLEMDIKKLSRYRVIYFPFPYYLPEGLAESLQKWIQKGGTLIAEAGFSGIVRETGLHSVIIPGDGFDKVFGALEGTRRSIKGGLSGRFQIKITSKGLKSEIHGNPYGASVSFPIKPKSCEAWGSFPTGEPALTHHSFGKGHAIWVGTYLGIEYYRNRTIGTRHLISNLVRRYSKVENPIIIPEGAGRADLLISAKHRWLVLQNFLNRATTLKIKIPIANISKADNLLREQKVKMVSNKKGSTGKFAIKEEVEIFELL